VSPPAGSERRAGARLLLSVGGLLLAGAVVLPLALLVRDRWDPLAQLDSRTEDAAHRAVLAHRLLLDAARVLTQLGAPLLLWAAALVLAALLARRSRRLAAYVLVSRVVAQLLSSGLKLLVDRARPTLPDPVAHAHGTSFPSGHALGAAAFWTTLAVALLPFAPRAARRALVVAALTVPVVVAATRVLLGVHYLTDVAAGLALGWAGVAVVTAVFVAQRRDEGLPAAAPLEEGLEPEVADE
jgi:membrane-associated phospholipid phosphatase